MEGIAAYAMFMLVAMAIGLSVIVTAVFCIALCGAASWVWTQSNLHVRTQRMALLIHRQI